MVQGMAFLSKKGFNPSNLSNQKVVWEAQQEKKHEAKRLRDRAEQLKRERDDEELARARGGARGGNEAALRFMYGPPPGLPALEKTVTSSKSDSVAGSEHQTSESQCNDITQRQPGDDDAAAAFRQMLAAASDPVDNDSVSADQRTATNQSTISGAALAGTTIEAASKGNESLSALEKAVGRKDANKSLTLEEQIARFPQLKNAPMAKGMNATNVNVNFKPLGTQLRHIRCLACGVWGHSRGDRECERSGWNPFAASSTVKPLAANDDSEPNIRSGLVPESKLKKGSRDMRDTLSRGSGSDEEGYRRSRKRDKKSKSSSRRREREEKRRRRSCSPSEKQKSRKKSHKRRRKHSSREE